LQDVRWSDLEEGCKYVARLEAIVQGGRCETTDDLGWRTGKKKLDATSTNLGRKRRPTRQEPELDDELLGNRLTRYDDRVSVNVVIERDSSGVTRPVGGKYCCAALAAALNKSRETYFLKRKQG
jgi:hypothetical protein